MLGKLTLKQRKFWKYYCETHSLSEAAKYAGSKGKDVKSLATIGHQILSSLELSMPELLNIEGLTPESMVKPLTNGLTAKRPLIATWQGKITDRIDIEDHPTRAKFLEIYHKLNGNFIDKVELMGKDGGDLILQITPAQGKKKKRTISLD